MNDNAALTKALEDILARMEQYVDWCNREILTVNELQQQTSWADAAVREAFGGDSPLFRIFHRRKAERTDYWSVTPSGYAGQSDCDNLSYRADTVRQILNELSPEFLRDEESRKTQYYFAPGETYRSKKKLLDIMRRATGVLSIVDEFLDADVFDYVNSLEPQVTVQLLTGNRKPVFKQLLAATQQARQGVEARQNTACHDRFIVLDGKEVWHLGASINGAGKAAFMVNKIVDAAERGRMLADAEQWWATGQDIQ